MLARYAVKESDCIGRQYQEPCPKYRSEFQRDRDRIIHSSAFRRLEYKTQVFVHPSGDMFRTRLTHTLEVTQIGRTVARALQVNEDLTEAICLAHDLGHAPFGHAGQDALNHCMSAYGGFEHNLHSLRLVDHLETGYHHFNGLNLMYETREGILKHCSKRNAKKLGKIGERFLNNQNPSIEAQIANIADEIAYTHHDLDDGIRARILKPEMFFSVDLFKEVYQIAQKQTGSSSIRTLRHEIKRRLIDIVVTDLIENSRSRIEHTDPKRIDDLRQTTNPMIGYSHVTAQQNLALKKLLNKHLYRFHEVNRMAFWASRIIKELFSAFMDSPDLLPEHIQQRITKHDLASRAQHVSDYIAGMTDRYAMLEHGKVFGPNHRSRDPDLYSHMEDK